jgi:hypothetical protein
VRKDYLLGDSFTANNEVGSMSNDQAPDKKRSRLKVGSIGILTTLLYLWLAVLSKASLLARSRL